MTKALITKKLFEHDALFAPSVVAGVDEAGRGPLAGPVVAAACIMPSDFIIEKINDSKKLSPKIRSELYTQIISSALEYKISAVDNKLIDQINILNATKLAMKNCILELSRVKPNIILTDAIKTLDISYKIHSIIKGDATSYAIAAASILAKVYRDNIMEKIDKEFPMYGFAQNKGYGTAAHIEALKKYGKCPYHRDTFIKNFIENE